MSCTCGLACCSELAALCDVLTMEIEHVNAEMLQKLEARGVQVEPSSRTILTIQDKYVQKQHMTQVSSLQLSGFPHTHLAVHGCMDRKRIYSCLPAELSSRMALCSGT